MHGKIMEFEKNLNNHEILWNNLTKPPVARKLDVGPTASFLATGGFKF